MVDAADPFLNIQQIKTVAENAAKAVVPKPATTKPPEAGVEGATGDDDKYARANHTHEVRARRKRVVLAAGTGTYLNMFVATWTFDKPFKTKPIIVCSPESDGGLPVFASAITTSFTKNAEGLWSSVVIRGWRAQAIPQNLAGLLVSAIFNVFGASPVGVVIGLTAAEETPEIT